MIAESFFRRAAASAAALSRNERGGGGLRLFTKDGRRANDDVIARAREIFAFLRELRAREIAGVKLV